MKRYRPLSLLLVSVLAAGCSDRDSKISTATGLSRAEIEWQHIVIAMPAAGTVHWGEQDYRLEEATAELARISTTLRDFELSSEDFSVEVRPDGGVPLSELQSLVRFIYDERFGEVYLPVVLPDSDVRFSPLTLNESMVTDAGELPPLVDTSRLILILPPLNEWDIGPDLAIKVHLSGDSDGSLEQIRIGHRPPGNETPLSYRRLHVEIAALVRVVEHTGDSADTDVLVEVSGSEELACEHLLKAVTVCAGRYAPDEDVHSRYDVPVYLGSIPKPEFKFNSVITNSPPLNVPVSEDRIGDNTQQTPVG